jgi:hypothetical protein
MCERIYAVVRSMSPRDSLNGYRTQELLDDVEEVTALPAS